MPAAGKPTVTRRLIAQTALGIIDCEGVGALSMHRVGRELGIQAPSLYHHFRDKDEILTAVARSVLLETPVLADPPPRQWRSWLLRQCLEFRRTILRHPEAAPLLLGYVPRELFAVQYERASLILDEAGVPLELHVLIFEAIDKLTIGSAMYAATTAGEEAFFPHLDPEETPTLLAAVEATPWETEEVFAKTLEGFLASIPAAPGLKPDDAAPPAGRRPSRKPSRRTTPPVSESRPPATRQLIAEAALDLIDSEGLSAVSMRKVASLLGMRGPSLYHHFADKTEVLTAVARSVLLQTPVIPVPQPSGWREWQVQQSLGYRRTILRHPNAAPLLLGYRPRELFPGQYERVSRLLVEAGVPYRYHLVVFEITDKFTLGSAMYAASTVDEPKFFPNFDTTAMPMLAKVLAANPWDPEQIFVEALRHFLTVIPDGRRQLR